MESIRVTTERLIKTWQGSTQREKGDPLKDGLRKVLTKQEQRHIKSHFLKDSRVILGVDSSAWLYLINLKKRQLLKKFNQSLKPKEEIVEIRLQLDTKKRHKG